MIGSTMALVCRPVSRKATTITAKIKKAIIDIERPKNPKVDSRVWASRITLPSFRRIAQ